MRRTTQRLAGLQLQVQQPRLAEKADINLDMKSRERMEGTTADDEKNGDISSALVDDDPMRLASFGEMKNSPNLQLSLNAWIVLWSTKTPKLQSRISHP